MAFPDDLASLYVTQGVGTLGNVSGSGNIFTSSKAILPSGNGPYLAIIETGGRTPARIQNKSSATLRFVTAQVCVIAVSEPAAVAMINSAFVVSDGVYNTVINGTSYLSITALQEPQDKGLDRGASSRIQLIFNLLAQFAP